MENALQAEISHDSLFYKLLMSREAKYRIGRHALFLLALTFISLNQVQMGLMEYQSLLGARLYLFMLFILFSYAAEAYLNIYVLIPKLFQKGKYALYFVVFSVMVAAFVLIHFGVEYVFFQIYHVTPGIYSYFKEKGSPLSLEFFSVYFTDYIAILGSGVTVILRDWLENDRKVHQLEQVYVQTEVDKMKEQVSPRFLFSVLHEVGDLAPENQAKASDILLKMSDILQYQLYDCNREQVLLSAEINIVTIYLQVEKLYDAQMNFEVETEGDIRHLFVPPLLFLPLVHQVVNRFKEKGMHFDMLLKFSFIDGYVSFFCDCPDADLLSFSGLLKIRQRLNSLYGNHHILRIEKKNGHKGCMLYLQAKQAYA